MDKLTYLIEAFNQRAYVKKAFLLSILSIINKGQEEKLKDIPYACQRDWDNNQCYFVRPGSDEKIILEGAVCDKPLFIKNEPIRVTVSDSNYIKEDVETTLGRYLFNVVVLFESFNGKCDYINDEVTDGTIKGIIKELMVDNPEPGEELPEGKASVDECLKLTQQMDYLEGLNPVLVKASSLDVFTIHPEILELRDKLLKEAEEKGQLSDPVAIAAIIDTLVDKDMEIQFNGPSKDLFIKKAFVSNNRKKMFIIFDMIPNFHDGKYELLRNSLAEGWELDKFSAYVNTAISASYSRSVQVGKAGYDVKVAILLTNRIRVLKGDCGTPRTEPVKITRLNFKGWIGGYYMSETKPTLLEKSDFDKLDGKIIPMRVPQYCQQPGGNLCSICCGQSLGKEENKVSSSVTSLLTKFFLLEMKAMHSSVLVTKPLDLESMLR